MDAETPIACPICLDHTIEPIEGVRLSASICGAVSCIHGVSAFHCSNWHVFTIFVPLGISVPPEIDTQRPVWPERGLSPISPSRTFSLTPSC